MTQNILYYRDLGLVPYQPIWDAMKAFTDNRHPETPDEIWFFGT